MLHIHDKKASICPNAAISCRTKFHTQSRLQKEEEAGRNTKSAQNDSFCIVERDLNARQNEK